MTRITQYFSALLCAFLLSMFAGCGGDDSETVAQAPPTPAQSAPAAKAEEPEKKEPEGYGSEDYGSEGGARRGSGRNSGGYEDYEGANAGSTGDDYGDAYGSSDSYGDSYGNSDGYGDAYGSSEGMYGGGSGEEGYDEYAGMSGSDYPGMTGDEGYAGYGMGDELAGVGGSGGGMGGSGMMGGAAGGFGMVTQFVRQNCANCHGRGQQKGGVSLDGISPNMEDPANVELLGKVVEVLEAGTMPPNRQLAMNQKQPVIAFVERALESSDSLDRSYMAQAESAFAYGREKQALNLLYAHAITANEEDARAVFEQLKWFGPAKEPKTTLRFAVGVNLTADEDLTDVKPLGSNQFGGGGGGRSGGYGGSEEFSIGGFGGGGGRSNSDGGSRTFNALTGDFGAALVAAFESRWQNGDLGSVFKSVVAKSSAGPAGNAAGGMGSMAGGGPGLGGPGLGGMGGMGSAGADYGGYGAGEDEYAGGSDAAGYGGQGYGSDRPGYGSEQGYGEEGESEGVGLATLRDNIRPGQTVTPGMVFIGSAKQAELLERAKNQGVDVVFVFDINAKKNRTNIVTNKTRLRCVLVDGNAIGATNTLTNTEIERAKMRGRDENELEKNIERLFTAFDNEIKLTSLPSFKPEHAESRINQLIAQKEALDEEEEVSMDLAILFEARMFHSLGLLSEQQLETVYQIVLEGNEGISLAQGTIDDRKLVVDGVLEAQG